MFYNGATRDARWRIGWVAFDRDCRRVLDLGIEPLIIPPPVDDRTATDNAFAASVLVRDSAIWLYYSLEDRRIAPAATVRYGLRLPAGRCPLRFCLFAMPGMVHAAAAAAVATPRRPPPRT